MHNNLNNIKQVLTGLIISALVLCRNKKQEGYLPQTDRTSSFASQKFLVMEKIFLSSSLITMQNLIIVSHTMCAHVEGPPKV